MTLMRSEQLVEAIPIPEIRRTLQGSGLVSPHAFIRELDKGYDLDTHLDWLLRPLPAEADLRVVCGAGVDERWVLMEQLLWDSEFFSRGVARLNAVALPGRPIDLRGDVAPSVRAIDQVMMLARKRGIDYVTCAVDSTDLPLVRALSSSGFDLIETRCHYHVPLSGPPPERHQTRLATAVDVPSLARAARDTVNPFDRFHADPNIPRVDTDRLMEEWVRASILGELADATIVPDVEAPEAFCTAKYHREHWQGWGLRLSQNVLTAVSTKHRGWYVRLMSELGEHLRGVGAEHAYLVTQITNNAVIWSLEKLGYRFGKGQHIFRKLL